MIQEIHLLSGPPGSGKSTWAVDYVETHPNVIHISRDVLRQELREKNNTDEYFPVSEKEEWMNWVGTINEHIKAGDSVIIDQTTLGRNSMLKLLNGIIIPAESHVITHVFMTSLAECQFRNGFREGHAYVPPNVIEKMHAGAFKSMSPGYMRGLMIQANHTPVKISVQLH